jgi:hypothetical protein
MCKKFFSSSCRRRRIVQWKGFTNSLKNYSGMEWKNVRGKNLCSNTNTALRKVYAACVSQVNSLCSLSCYLQFRADPCARRMSVRLNFLLIKKNLFPGREKEFKWNFWGIILKCSQCGKKKVERIFSPKKCEKWINKIFIRTISRDYNSVNYHKKYFGLINHNKNSCTFGEYWNANFTVHWALHEI